MKTNHGTDEKTLELMHKATGLIEDMNADVTRLKGDVRSLKMAHGALGGIRDSETSLQLRSDVARLPRGQAMKALFELKHGEAASEALEGFGRFLKACWHKSRGNHEEAARYASEELKMTSDWTVRGKAYNTVTGATAGTMVPDVWVPELDRLKQVYGRLVAMCRTIEVPPGVEANVSGMSAATMTWRPTQNTSITESEPEAVNLKLRPVLLGGICTVSNELLELESLNFGAVIGEEFIRAGVQAEEEALLQGDDGGVHPHDGILLLSGTSDQGNIATMTRENLMTFLSAAQLDHDEATSAGNVIAMTTDDWLALKADCFGSNFDPMPGGDFLGRFPVIDTPACRITATRYVTLFDPSTVWVARVPGYRIDFNPYLRFAENATDVRVMTFMDYGCPRPDRLHFATVGA